LPVGTTEVGLWFWEQEGIHSTIQMGVARSSRVPRNHDDGAHWTELGQKSGRRSTVWS
jgi:hypothetical protein